jgi:hypothetical protein
VSGAVRVIAPLTNARSLGGTWSRREEILFSVPGDGMYSVPASGGLPSRVTPSVDDTWSGCSAWPFFLPDGRHFLYTLMPAKGVTPGVYLAELGKADGRLLIDAFSSSAYCASGFLLFARDGTVYVQPFDAKRLQIEGQPRPIVDGVAFNPRTGRVLASMSDAGVLAFRRPLITQLVWVDRRGAPQAVVASLAIYMDFSIAPDGRRVAAARVDAHTGASDVWVFGDGIESRITNAPDWDVSRLDGGWHSCRIQLAARKPLGHLSPLAHPLRPGRSPPQHRCSSHAPPSNAVVGRDLRQPQGQPVIRSLAARGGEVGSVGTARRVLSKRCPVVARLDMARLRTSRNRLWSLQPDGLSQQALACQ